MSYTVIIAEKPSVASSIAKIVGANTPHRDKANGYLEGNGYRVTWAFGHLVGLDSPEQMGFPGETLPIFPDEWKTHIIQAGKSDMNETVTKQMKTIEGLFEGAQRIIVATDAGREGELIFRYIYEYLGCHTPFDRLWISSLEEEPIRKGMNSLIDGAQMEPLAEAAHARSEADWLVGFNASRALRIASGFKGNLSLGRVQTPVLCMICQRYLDNKNFVPTPYWQIVALVHKDMTNVPISSVTHYTTEEAANEAMKAVQESRSFLVKNIESKDITSRPPLLYDLTTLQREANSKYGMTADETLKVAQSLYEKKYLTYPRTGSRYVPEDIYKIILGLIKQFEDYDRDSFREMAIALRGQRLCRHSVDDSKVTDHHALLPTRVMPSGLTGNELRIWEMVAGRMLEAFGIDSISHRTNIELECASIVFKTSCSELVKPGWKAVFGTVETDEEKKQKEEESNEQDELFKGKLPPMAQGERLPGTKIEKVRKTDKPQPIYTENSLLGDMETCGKKIEDEELREAMKDVGLGTAATRAATIEILVKRQYIVRSGRKLIPTELGLQIAQTVKGRKIADVKTTGEWERELSLIERGQKQKSVFDAAIRDYTQEIIKDLTENCRSFDGISTTAEATRKCPLCGHPMKNMKYDILCEESSGGCGARIPREIAKKKLPLSAINALAENKTTPLIKGFTSKSGKTFDARLKMDPATKKPAFIFEEKEKAPVMQGKICPCCGKTLIDDPWKLTCECGLTIFKSYGQAKLTENEINALLSGKSVPKSGMVSKAGKKFSAQLMLNKDNKKIDFIFEHKKR